MHSKDIDPKGSTDASDDTTENAHYNKEGEINHIDNRDRKNSLDDWDAEGNRSGRHK